MSAFSSVSARTKSFVAAVTSDFKERTEGSPAIFGSSQLASKRSAEERRRSAWSRKILRRCEGVTLNRQVEVEFHLIRNAVFFRFFEGPAFEGKARFRHGGAFADEEPKIIGAVVGFGLRRFGDEVA